MDVEPSWKELERWDAFYDALLSRTGELSGVADAGAVYTPAAQWADRKRHDSGSCWSGRARRERAVAK